jgi:hypothetical protein
MDILRRVIHRRPANRYDKKGAEIEPTYRLSTTRAETENTISEIRKPPRAPSGSAGNKSGKAGIAVLDPSDSSNSRGPSTMPWKLACPHVSKTILSRSGEI